MATISSYFSLQSSLSNYYPSLEQVSERFHKIDWHQASPWIQLAAITSAICGACILAKKGTLPREIPMVCCVTVIYFTLSLAINSIVLKSMGILKEEPLFEVKSYAAEIKYAPTWNTCIATPIVEEIFFRALLQRGLHFALSRAFKTTQVEALGFKTSVAAFASTLIASYAFGIAHIQNHSNDPFYGRIHAITAGMRSLVLFGPLYHQHGLWAASLSHVLSNTIAQVLMRT